jgi:hypothetical protein
MFLAWHGHAGHDLVIARACHRDQLNSDLPMPHPGGHRGGHKFATNPVVASAPCRGRRRNE